MGVTPDLTKRYNASEMIKKISVSIGGTGGVGLILLKREGQIPANWMRPSRRWRLLFRPWMKRMDF